VTPGYAKPRSELPWLPYEEHDRVIINAHNFTPPVVPFDPSVNGKTPIAVWCPSRDDAGNGTTTLNDRVGSNNGTLTNMDAATDWVADTAAGGVRALDFDGANDRVDCGTIAAQAFNNTAAFAISCWVYARATSSERGIVTRVNSSDQGWALCVSSGAIRFPAWNNGPQFSISIDTWYHVVAVSNGGTRYLYVDGVLRASNTDGSIVASSVATVLGRYYGNFSGYVLNGRIDDVRLWDVALDLADAEDLYASGSGRGISA
jgi:hypothetical protein